MFGALLIGGATTSPQHTAVKIAPQYEEPVVHVLDASRAVGVVSDLLSEERRADFVAQNQTAQQKLRDQHGSRQEKPLLSLDAASATSESVAPKFTLKELTANCCGSIA